MLAPVYKQAWAKQIIAITPFYFIFLFIQIKWKIILLLNCVFGNKNSLRWL